MLTKPQQYVAIALDWRDWQEENGFEANDDSWIDELDRLWNSMNSEEQEEAMEEASRAIANNAVPVERAVVTAVEWLAVQEQIDVLVQEQAEYQVHEAQLTEQLESQARTIRELQEEVEALRTDIEDLTDKGEMEMNDYEQ